MSISELDEDQSRYLWDLYINWCRQRGLPPRPDEFTLWLEERY